MKIKKTILTSGIAAVILISSALPAFAAGSWVQSTSGIKRFAITGSTSDMLAQSSILKTEGTEAVYAEANTSAPTSAADKVSITLNGSISGTTLTPVSKSETDGGVTVTLTMGTNQSSNVYAISASHKAYLNGTQVSSGTTSCTW